MSYSDDQFGSGSAEGQPRLVTGPDQWLGMSDPVETFGQTVDQALRSLSIELAGLRAERDGMRLELEGLRTQLELTQQRLADRDHFTTTVRELSQIVQRLTLPPRWAPDPVAAPPAPPVAAVVPPEVVPVEPVVPVAPQAEVWAPPVEPAPAPVAPVVTEAIQMPAAAADASTAPAPPPPAAPVEPPVEPVGPVATVAPTVEPEVAAPAPEPAPEPESPWTPSDSFRFDDVRAPAQSSSLAEREESFFSQPGVWLGEPPEKDLRSSQVVAIGRKAGTVLLSLVVLMVLLISVGPKLLPYQSFFVRSGSMSPTFDTGDMIVLTKVDASDIEQGDIITFDRPDKPGTLVTHRVVAVETDDTGKRQFQTKGDANGEADAWRVPASGDGWRYATRIPKVGYVFGYLGTPQARFALLAIPAVLLGVLSLIDIWKPQKPKARRS